MKVTALAGGVGGAKLAEGLAQILSPDDLTIIVNTGDDFIHYGLSISPDLDTVCYTLAGMANPSTGWGLRDESWNTNNQLKKFDNPVWFQLGDKDLATHLERTRLLKDGMPLSVITNKFCKIWGIRHPILPMTDDRLATIVIDEQNRELDFQEYFVKHHYEPKIRSIRFDGIQYAKPAPGVAEALINSDLIIICPSNPFVSIDPILALPGILRIMQQKTVVSVSPIIGGQAVKGPLAKMILELTGETPSASFIAKYYRERGILSGYILDKKDDCLTSLINGWGIICEVIDTLMVDAESRARVAGLSMKIGNYLLRSK